MLPAQAIGASSDGQTPQAGKFAQTVEEDLIAEKFADLDAMANKYRLEKTRVAGSGWRLRQFYAALDKPELTDKDTAEHIEHLRHWMTARPDSITPRVALATSLHRWAWVARGNGMANTVSAEGWQQFDERIKEAQVILEGSENMVPMCPQWYSEMMVVGLAQSWEPAKMKALFERGSLFAPDYFYLYKEYANYLLPKWDGRPGDAAKFAKESADRRGGDEGDELYYHIAAVLISRSNGNYPVAELTWDRIQRGAAAVAAHYGGTLELTNDLAYMAYKYRDRATTQKLLAQIGDKWSRDVWRDKKFFDKARDWAQSQTQWPTAAGN